MYYGDLISILIVSSSCVCCQLSGSILCFNVPSMSCVQLKCSSVLSHFMSISYFYIRSLVFSLQEIHWKIFQCPKVSNGNFFILVSQFLYPYITLFFLPRLKRYLPIFCLTQLHRLSLLPWTMQTRSFKL